MLLSQPLDASNTLYAPPHMHARPRRPKLSLNTTAAASSVPLHLLTSASSSSSASASSSSSMATPLSPTTRNTLQNRYLRPPPPPPHLLSSSTSPSSLSSSSEYVAPSSVGMKGSYFPTASNASFCTPSRRVAFSETVVVIPRD